MRCVYNDEKDSDHDALVLRDHADSIRDLVIVMDGRPVIVERVRHRSALIEMVEVLEVMNRKGDVLQPPMTQPKRQPGAFWRD